MELATIALRNFLDPVDDILKGLRRSHIGNRFPLPFDQRNLLFNIPRRFNQDETPFGTQVPIDGAYLPTENAEDRDAQGRRLSVHGSTAADHQIRIENQVQPVQRLAWE